MRMFYALCLHSGYTPAQIEAMTPYDYAHLLALMVMQNRQTS
tara:strand:+ start:233 stop:358 length:126 start_codon:yes stop_codon:yes gene_type:complete